MKHIKIFEDYTDDELKDLMGDLKGVGHSNIIFNVDLSRAAGDKNEIKEEGEDWESENDPGVYASRIDGHIINKNSPEDIDLKVNLSNGDRFEFVIQSRGGDFWDDLGFIKIITSQGKEIKKEIPNSIYDYPGGWILSSLHFYDELIPEL